MFEGIEEENIFFFQYLFSLTFYIIFFYKKHNHSVPSQTFYEHPIDYNKKLYVLYIDHNFTISEIKQTIEKYIISRGSRLYI